MARNCILLATDWNVTDGAIAFALQTSRNQVREPSSPGITCANQSSRVRRLIIFY